MLPKFSEIPSIITTIRNPRQRAVSVGPQSEADAYETLAYREKRRRESRSNGSTTDSKPSPAPTEAWSTSAMRKPKLNEYENMMGTGTPRYSSPHVPAATDDRTDRSSPPVPFPDYEEPPDEAEVFSQIKRPRVRYDVEVVTKLIVYSGKRCLYLRSTRLLLTGCSRYWCTCPRGSSHSVRLGRIGNGTRHIKICCKGFYEGERDLDFSS